MNTAKRGVLWSICFWVSCFSSLSLAIPMLKEDELMVMSISIIAFWIWRIKFVFCDLNPKHIKIDIWMTGSVIGIKVLMVCYGMYTDTGFSFGEIGELFYHDGMIAIGSGILFYGIFFAPFGQTGFSIAAFLSFVFNPMRILYLITEIKLLRSLRTQLSKESI